MFEAESVGLGLLKKTNCIVIPEVYSTGQLESTSYIIMEHIVTESPSSSFWEDFGQQLALLHKKEHSVFGLETDNYIGSLPQYNKGNYTKAPEFYIEKRLEPQFQMAAKNGFTFGNLHTFYKNIKAEIPDEPASLIHGDLWSGNYLVNQNGNPCLIDPAVAYAPREMDIAMMHLFGGFQKHYLNLTTIHSRYKMVGKND
ncbi:hypothetical protein Y10_13760 [Neptunitalea sp. Y10]|uniref:Fructosamine kinase n=1 Tax=Neptunitalea lumnitzerae TaxID=2965509 RepID=A0ABQ5MHZ4_9FLAO|nr:hypothetical protein Y10_13760 [Neptunitalea sp. Y10]